MSYATVKFQVAMYNRLGGDTITRNVTDGQTHRLTKDRLWYGNNIPLFPKKTAGIHVKIKHTQRHQLPYYTIVSQQQLLILCQRSSKLQDKLFIQCAPWGTGSYNTYHVNDLV